MLNPENPTHKAIMSISKSKGTTFKGSTKIKASVIPQLFGHTSIELRDIDYLMLASDYEDYIEKYLEQLMRKDET